MNITKSLMGRRQFLIAAGVTSASTLALKNLEGLKYTALETRAATAAEKAGAGGIKLQSGRYANLLSPLKIGNVILKNRMYCTNAVPHNLQGPENFPAEPSRSFAAGLAKNGAAL